MLFIPKDPAGMGAIVHLAYRYQDGAALYDCTVWIHGDVFVGRLARLSPPGLSDIARSVADQPENWVPQKIADLP